MKKLDKFIAKSYIGPLVLTFFIATFILLLQFIWRYMDELVGKGLPFSDVAEFLWYACWTFVPLSLPLAVLLSSLMLFGTLGEHYELVAAKAAGIPLRRLMASTMVMSVLISGLAFYFTNNAVPKAYMLHRQKYHEIQTQRPAVNLQDGVYYYGIPDYVIRVSKKRDDGRYLEDVQIYDHSQRKGNCALTMSKTGSMYTLEDGRYLVFNLFDGYTYGEDISNNGQKSLTADRQAQNPFTCIKFDTQTLIMDLSKYDSKQNTDNLYVKHQKALALKPLGKEIDTLRMRLNERVGNLVSNINSRNYFLSSLIGNDSAVRASFNADVAAGSVSGAAASASASAPSEAVRDSRYVLPEPTLRDLREAAALSGALVDDMEYYKRDVSYLKERLNAYRVEEHKKFSLSVGCLILFFIGAPLGALIRKGGMGMPVVVSVLLFVSYYVLSVIGEKAAIEGSLTCTLGSWLSTFVFLPFGLLLTLQVTIDSSFLDADTWRTYWNKLFKKK